MSAEAEVQAETEAASRELPLCLGCLTPNEPLAHFCVKCGAPMTSYAATGPFESLLAEGHAYRQAAGSPRRLIVVLGVWMIFGSIALAAGFILWMGLSEAALPGVLMGGCLLAISTAMIWKTTRNYLNRPQPEALVSANPPAL